MNRFKMCCLLAILLYLWCPSVSYGESGGTYEFGTLLKDRELGQCGIFALYAVLYSNNIEVSYDEIFSEINSNEENEVNLLQLAHYAERKGMFYRGIRNPKPELVTDILDRGAHIIMQFFEIENCFVLSAGDLLPGEHHLSVFIGSECVSKIPVVFL